MFCQPRISYSHTRDTAPGVQASGSIIKRRMFGERAVGARVHGAAVRVLYAAGPSAADMDAEWARILENDEDEDDEEEEEDEEEEDEADISDEELLLGFEVTDADFDASAEAGGPGEQHEEPGRASRWIRTPRVPYKEYIKMKREKAAAWAEKRKTFTPEHNAAIDEAEKNKMLAAER